MKIRTVLTIKFTAIVASLLLVFAVAIYYFSSSYRENEFYKRLYEKANDYGKLSIEVRDLNADQIKLFDRNTAYLPDERILVYDSDDKELFNTLDDKVSTDKNFLQQIRAEKEIRYKEGKKEALAIRYEYANRPYVVVVSAYDFYGFEKLKNLKIILLIGFFSCTIVTMLAGWIWSRQALNPISKVITQVEKITASDLSQRLNEGNGTDEIGQLAITFNGMLQRIQKAFGQQKSFVANSSHELRTPLTSITGQLEVALMNNNNSVDDFKSVVSSVLEDIKNVNRLANGLLELSQAEIDISNIRMERIRIDELLWLSRTELIKRTPKCKVNIEMKDFPEDEERLIVCGNEHLLQSAFMNIMDNACKFSDQNEVSIGLRVENNNVLISFLDRGIGISEEDLKRMAEPFHRGGNARAYSGHGLGMALTQKIVAVHKGEISFSSKLNEFTRVNVSLRSVSETV